MLHLSSPPTRRSQPSSSSLSRTALIVGADYIDPLKKTMAEFGYRDIDHWTGRKTSDLRRTIPRSVQLLVVLCDFVNHGLVKKVREDARSLGIPVLYCRRSLGEVREKLVAMAAA